jgi:predicted nucleotidyltransferase
MDMDKIATKCKNVLAHYYGTQLKGLILYGSAARNQATPESDIDLLVLLNNPFDYFQELRCIVDLLYPIQLESNYLISAKPAAIDEFENGDLQLYRNIKLESVFL